MVERVMTIAAKAIATNAKLTSAVRAAAARCRAAGSGRPRHSANPHLGCLPRPSTSWTAGPGQAHQETLAVGPDRVQEENHRLSHSGEGPDLGAQARLLAAKWCQGVRLEPAGWDARASAAAICQGAASADRCRALRHYQAAASRCPAMPLRRCRNLDRPHHLPHPGDPDRDANRDGQAREGNL